MPLVRCWSCVNMSVNLSSESDENDSRLKTLPPVGVEALDGPVPRVRLPGHRYVTLCLCPRNPGVTIDVDLTPDSACKFDCVYCSTRGQADPTALFQLDIFENELNEALDAVLASGWLREVAFPGLDALDMRFGQVAFSGSGEPTLCPFLPSAVRAVVHQRARGDRTFFKMILLTNGSLLNRAGVMSALEMFCGVDELWVKLDAGEPEAFEKVTRGDVSLDDILANLGDVGKRFPITIQTVLFHLDAEAGHQCVPVADCLKELIANGVRLERVQLGTVWGGPPRVKALSVQELSKACCVMNDRTGLPVEMY